MHFHLICRHRLLKLLVCGAIQGFPAAQAKKALQATHNCGVELALGWLVENQTADTAEPHLSAERSSGGQSMQHAVRTIMRKCRHWAGGMNALSLQASVSIQVAAQRTASLSDPSHPCWGSL